MVSKKEKINKLIKKLKGKRKPQKKKTGLKQKQRQKQSVVQNVRISAPQQSQRAIGFPTQVITTPAADTEFLRSVIQQQNLNNLTRDYQAKNPQEIVRLDDQIGLRTQRAFPQPLPPQIESTIPEAQQPSMSDPNFREAMLQQQDMMVAKANANAPKSKRVKVSKDVAFATAVPIIDDVKESKKERKEQQKYKKASIDELFTIYTTGTPIQRNKAKREGLARGYTQEEIDKASGLATPKKVPVGLTTPKKVNPNLEAFFKKKETPPTKK